MNSLVNSIGSMLAMGAILGFALGLAGNFFAVKEDERVATVTAMLPGYNCGGCGYPGCAGMAEGLVGGQVTKVAQCKPSKQDAREKIAAYLNEATGPNGEKVSVTAN